MLTEYDNLRQDPDGFRRLFYDKYFDLYVWYDREGGSMTGFQLVYDKVDDPHTLTWLEGEGYLHNKIDDGEAKGRIKMTPILVPDGVFDQGGVDLRFMEATDGLDPAVRDYVHARLAGFDPGALRRFP